MEKDYRQLPDDLPVPEDDGAADHLEGLEWPSVTLDLVPNGKVALPDAFGELGVIFVYPRTGTPGNPLIRGWDEIPGARGCTPQNCAYRDAYDRFTQLGACLFGLSGQPPEEQADFLDRENPPYLLLNDRAFHLGAKLNLPTFEADGMTLYRRITLVIRAGRIVKVFYPVFPPDEDAETVLRWLTST